jgi:hypothetical protein
MTMSTIPGNGPPGDSMARQPVTSRPMTPLEKRMSEDLRWASQSPEVQQYHGKLVVIRNKRIIAVGNDQKSLLRQAAAQEGCPEWEFVVEVVPPDDLWEIPVDLEVPSG